MAHIGNCDVCGKRTVNEARHDRCNTAFLNDLLWEIQCHCKRRPKRQLPKSLIKKLKGLELVSLSTFLRQEEERFAEEATKQAEASIHQHGQIEAMQVAARKFNAEHPPTNGQTYAAKA